MAGDAITQYLAAQELDRFTAIVRRYSHDVISSAANLVIAAEVSNKLITNRTAQVLADPKKVEASTHQFEILRHYGLGFPRLIRRFVWGNQPDDPRLVKTYIRYNWYPYDAPKWDQFVKEYIKFVTRHFQPIDQLGKEIAAWADSGALTSPEKSGDLRDTIAQIPDTVGRVWALLDPSVAEQRVLPVIEAARAE